MSSIWIEQKMWYANFTFNGIACGIKAFLFGGDRLQPQNKEARLAYVTQTLYKNSSVKQVLFFFFFNLSLRICNAKTKKKDGSALWFFYWEKVSKTPNHDNKNKTTRQMLDPLNVLILDSDTSRARGLFGLHFHSNPWGCAVDHKSIPVIKKAFGRKMFSHLRKGLPIPQHTHYTQPLYLDAIFFVCF